MILCMIAKTYSLKKLKLIKILNDSLVQQYLVLFLHEMNNAMLKLHSTKKKEKKIIIKKNTPKNKLEHRYSADKEMI